MIVNLSEYLKALRTSRNLLQKDLAPRLGVTPSYLSSLETGSRHSLGKRMRARYRQVLELTADETRQLEELSQAAASRKIAIPDSATDEEAEVFHMLAECVGRVAPSHFQNIKRYLEASMLMAGMDPGTNLRR